MWTLVAEAEFGARARRDRPWVSVPGPLPRSAGPAAPGTSTLGPGKRMPRGSCQAKRRRGPGRTAQLGPRGGRPSEQGERAGWALRASLLWKMPGGWHLPASTPRQRGQRTRNRHLGMDAEGQWAEARGRGRGRDGTGWEGERRPGEKGPFAGLSLRRAQSKSCSLWVSGGHPETQHFLGATQGDTDLPFRPGTNFHHKPLSATTCHPAPLGRLRSQVGAGRKCGVDGPLSLQGQQSRAGGSIPLLPTKATGPAPATPRQL